MWVTAGINICSAQLEWNYTPRKTFSKDSKELIAAIQEQRELELEETPKEDRKIIESYFELKSKYLIHLVKSGFVIDDDSLQNLVESIFDQIVVTNQIVKKPGIVLIIKSPIINATCYGDGIFAVSVGLLSRMQSESQLAFVLAHELAHYQKDHVKEKIVQFVKSEYQNKLKTGIKEIWNSDDVTPDQIEEVQKLVYQSRNYSRAMEYEADSIGFKYLANSPFVESAALELLDKLDSAKYSKYNIGLRSFLPLDSEHYLLQPEWMRKRLSVYSKPPVGTFLSEDSLKSHPDIKLRKARLLKWIKDRDSEFQFPEFQYQIERCDFEVVESLYWLRQADRALYEALQLLSLYPKNSYLISTISKILIRVNERNIQIPTYTYQYDETLLLVNNFLQNTTREQIGEIVYHFLANPSNFTPDSQEQHYLLWKICSLTARNQEKNRLKAEYKRIFPTGKYLGVMKDNYSLDEALRKLKSY